MKGSRILILDDEPEMLENLSRLLTGDGFVCHTRSSATGLEQELEEFRPAILISDLRMPGADGMEVLDRARAVDEGLPVILITGHATVSSAVAAIQKGAFDYLAKPFSADQLSVAVQRALRYRGLLIENESLRLRVGPTAVQRIVGESPAVRRIFAQIERVAPTEASVLITGESGTGKELLARAVHEASARRSGPFVPVDCAALPEGLLESELYGHEKGAFTGAVGRREGLIASANGGTLFLDEIGEMPLALQAKLLRALEERQVRSVGSSRYQPIDVRMIAATNVDLAEEVDRGSFRGDLYYRLNVVHFELPPLRERAGDVPLLVQRFVERFARESGRKLPHLEPGFLATLEAYAWPGNVRQLRNAIERAVILDQDGRLGVDDLPPEVTAAAGGPAASPSPVSG
ncbi:MAG: sigma-54-dependent Fis family transcriptional regulator, partial [Gemmatimonadetes bacterium]|nr:sigma-54-dependent Fis family transcriptional regulator [Gemmatimonadota bacterium]